APRLRAAGREPGRERQGGGGAVRPRAGTHLPRPGRSRASGRRSLPGLGVPGVVPHRPRGAHRGTDNRAAGLGVGRADGCGRAAARDPERAVGTGRRVGEIWIFPSPARAAYSTPQREERMNGNRRTGLALAIPLAILLAVLLSGGRGAERVGAAPNTSYEDLETFTNVLPIIQKNYVEDVDTKRLVEGAINGMLASLDPHSAYLTPELYKELQVETKGSFGGLGIEITNPNGILTVGAPIEDTPAYRAGIKPQDIILKIDGEFTKDMSLVEAVKKMRGPKNTKVKLTIKREHPQKLLEGVLTRAVIKTRSVKPRALPGGIGYLRVTQFQEHSDDDVERALRQ